MRKRVEDTQKQMELLQTLVQGVQLQGEAASKRADNDKDVRILRRMILVTTFEKLMIAYEVKAERWAFKQATNL